MDLALRHSIEKHFILKDVFHNNEPSSGGRGWGWGWGGGGGRGHDKDVI